MLQGEAGGPGLDAPAADKTNPDTPRIVEFVDHLEARSTIRIHPYGLAGAQTVEVHVIRQLRAGVAGIDSVEHSAEVYGISGSGKITTLYPSNFKPQQIVHDVPMLADS